jgi:hypothetical protein
MPCSVVLTRALAMLVTWKSYSQFCMMPQIIIIGPSISLCYSWWCSVEWSHNLSLTHASVKPPGCFKFLRNNSRNNQHYAMIVPLRYSIYWLPHVSAVACHHQETSQILLSYLKYKSNGWYIIYCVVTWPVCRGVVVPSVVLHSWVRAVEVCCCFTVFSC